MEFSPRNMEYRFRKSHSAYLVWLEALNRYLRMEEPAFRIFRQMKEGHSPTEMVQDCAETYQLPEGEAERFIGEIREKLRILYRDYQVPESPSLSMKELPDAAFTSCEKTILINGQRIRFRFGDPTIDQFIFPMFGHLEDGSESGHADLLLEVYKDKRKIFLVKNKEEAFAWELSDAHKLKGALLLELVNLIHHKSTENWIGVIHASAVSQGRKAVMFPAQPGAGKSTLAALMMAHGCKLVSDDFTPVALESQNLYSLPAAISIKEGSLPLLKSHYPHLKSAPQTKKHSTGQNLTFLAPKDPCFTGEEDYPVSAIVFVQYDNNADCTLERLSNLEVINDFLTESWLAHHTEAAERFMDWYLSTPCYSLRYGNHRKAVESIQKLF